jgi:hypothetical protein
MLVGADMDGYINNALGLLREGRFAVPGAEELSTFLTPLYPALIAANMWIFGVAAGPNAMIYEQIILLFLTGLLVASIITRTHPQLAFPALLLMIFNPNSFAAAHGTQTETVFTFLLTATLYLFFKYVSSRRFWLLPIIGLFVATTAYCRPAGLYFGLMIPAGAALYATAGSTSLRDGATKAGLQFARALIVVIVAMAALSPWYLRNHDTVGQYVFSTNLGLYLRDNVIYVLTKTHNKPAQDMSRSYDRRFEEFAAQQETRPGHKMNRAELSDMLVRFSVQELSGQPFTSIARAAVQSVVFLYGSAGTGNLRELWGFQETGIYAIENFEGDGSIFGSALLFVERISISSIGLIFTGLVFAFGLRLLGLAGLYAMLRSPHWRDFIIYVAILSFFTGMYLFIGQPRFRLPMEPILVIIALWGWHGIKGWRQSSQREATGTVSHG